MKTYDSVVARFPLIAYIVAGFFGVSVAVGFVYVVATWAYLSGTAGLDGTITVLAELDDLVDYATIAANLVLTVALIVVLFRFTSMAAANADFTGKHTPFMAIVGSLVPILSIFWPLRMYRTLIHETAESGRADLVKLSLQFWIPWAGSGLISAQAFRMETSLRLSTDGFDVSTFVVVLVAWLFSDILILVAVLRARVFFARLAPALDAA